MAEPEPALVLTDQDAGEAHFGERLPQIAAEAVGIVGVAELAEVLDRRVLAHEIPRGVREHGLFVIEVEGHFLLRRPGEGRGRWVDVGPRSRSGPGLRRG